MKLHRYMVSLNGNRLAADEFGYVLKQGQPMTAEGVDEIAFPCRGGKFAYCSVRVTLGDKNEAEARWHWDGNMDEPTLTPSIGCDVAPRCGWHGHITKGEILP